LSITVTSKPEAHTVLPPATRHLRTLFRIVMTNSEARKLLSDFSVIGRDLLSKTAAKAAETMAPSEEALRNVDHPGESNRFETDNGRPTDTAGLQVPLPGTSTSAAIGPEGDTQVINNGSSLGRDEVKERGRDVAGQVASEGRRHAEDIRSSEAPVQEAQAKKAGLMDRMKGVTVCLSSISIWSPH
jgi:hypothetical protein